MKVALLSDLHGNADALAAVLASETFQGVEQVCVCGDLVGYYYQPDRILKMLTPWSPTIIRGNHEDMLGRASTDSAYQAGIRQRYGSGHDLALERLDATQLAWLQSLPETATLELDGQRILLCHGTPSDTDEYLYPDASQERFAEVAKYSDMADVIVMGHTHYRMHKVVAGVHLINPGSVGQPRDRQPGASWALLDTANGAPNITLITTSYDPTATQTEAGRRDPHLPYLQKVLVRQ